MSLAESFGRSGFARFITSPAGRITRLVVGLPISIWGYLQLPATGGIVLLVVGLVLLATGSFHLCLISALLGGPISGSRVARNFSDTSG